MKISILIIRYKPCDFNATIVTVNYIPIFHSAYYIRRNIFYFFKIEKKSCCYSGWLLYGMHPNFQRRYLCYQKEIKQDLSIILFSLSNTDAKDIIWSLTRKEIAKI